MKQLKGVSPPLAEAEITRERLVLEEAIKRIENEAAQKEPETPRAPPPPREPSRPPVVARPAVPPRPPMPPRDRAPGEGARPRPIPRQGRLRPQALHPPPPWISTACPPVARGRPTRSRASPPSPPPRRRARVRSGPAPAGSSAMGSGVRFKPSFWQEDWWRS